MNYVVIGQVRSKTGGIYPVIDMPMMSDERWQKLAEENAIHNYTEVNGHAPESARVACEWQRAWIAMKNLT
ncbi:hypothetical protein EAI89_19070 [Eubacterium sp. am_0171]|uniref:Uncharacterized protein n=1 Tax=Faecalicatena contorta TaxID=39482 RepID=A0A174CIN7_9FIRM|nr:MULTISPECIES: hypothetical protein [Clostridia]MDU7723521.1 hypothetical protein [Citrobacter sp.]MSC85927.1 hypothetical protein [Eubacterium sp. BIOML-A1]MSD08300.1 hypothetical protein [Eubacterium sp. BIOML-A2]RYT12660.1 hypothetical protein EAI89_19070 [Eubacterium sp. am_0171]CUO13004.1 Uncharacterised protein [[Eubacterium] contortum] [Faecalicatena contorta]